jgi:hypothetical protein
VNTKGAKMKYDFAIIDITDDCDPYPALLGMIGPSTTMCC